MKQFAIIAFRVCSGRNASSSFTTMLSWMMIFLMAMSILQTRPVLAQGLITTAASATAATPTKHIVLVIGDSLSAEYGLTRGSGWVNLMAQRLGTVAQVVNASISGDTTAGGLSRIDAALKTHAPRWVIIELGANDALRGLSLQVTQNNLTKMIQAARNAKAQVLVVGMRLPPNYGTYGAQFEAMYTQLAKDTKVAFVPFLLDGFAEKMEWFQADKIHPNEKAQARMLSNVWPALEKLLPKK